MLHAVAKTDLDRSAECDHKKAQEQADSKPMPSEASQAASSGVTPHLPPGLKLPPMPKGWKPGMPIPGGSAINCRLSCFSCFSCFSCYLANLSFAWTNHKFVGPFCTLHVHLTTKL